MTPNQQVLSDELILHKLDTHVGGPNPSYPLDKSDWINFARAIESATLAALAQQAQPVHQFRRRLCAEWYDGHPDHEDGGGPYETRILYTAQQAQPVDEQAEFEASMREKHGWVARDFQSDSFGYFDGHTATAWLAWRARAALQTKGQP